jgi:hypothetical protein
MSFDGSTRLDGESVTAQLQLKTKKINSDLIFKETPTLKIS